MGPNLVGSGLLVRFAANYELTPATNVVCKKASVNTSRQSLNGLDIISRFLGITVAYVGVGGRKEWGVGTAVSPTLLAWEMIFKAITSVRCFNQCI